MQIYGALVGASWLLRKHRERSDFELKDFVAGNGSSLLIVAMILTTASPPSSASPP